jgi:hypothetical protein
MLSKLIRTVSISIQFVASLLCYVEVVPPETHRQLECLCWGEFSRQSGHTTYVHSVLVYLTHLLSVTILST